MAELTPKTITELPELTSIPDTAAFAVSSGGASRRVLWSTIKSIIFGSLSAQAYVINGVNFIFRRYGKIVVCTTDGAVTNAVSSSASMGNVQVADTFKPITAEIRYIQVTPTAVIQFNLNTSGLFQVGYAYPEIAAGVALRGTFVYMAAG